MKHFRVSVCDDICNRALSPNTYFVRLQTEDLNGNNVLDEGDRLIIVEENLDDGERWNEVRVISGTQFSEVGLVKLINDILKAHQSGSASLEERTLKVTNRHGDRRVEVSLETGLATYFECGK